MIYFTDETFLDLMIKNMIEKKDKRNIHAENVVFIY
jgi:hypothetical protein